MAVASLVKAYRHGSWSVYLLAPSTVSNLILVSYIRLQSAPVPDRFTEAKALAKSLQVTDYTTNTQNYTYLKTKIQVKVIKPVIIQCHKSKNIDEFIILNSPTVFLILQDVEGL